MSDDDSDSVGNVVERVHPTLVHHVVNTLGWPGLTALQRAALEPLTDGDDAVLLAPTAGGKTEAAIFPLLSAMEAGGWEGLSVVYVCPIKALLNSLLPRMQSYAGWLGRRAALWHGDTTTSARQRILRDPPDILLTTPESLEAMLVSAKTDHRRLFGGLRATVVDEMHAFAGDDRGWHLLAVLERLGRIAGADIQRVGLSATIGNPNELLEWLQGSGAGRRSGRVVAPEVSAPSHGATQPPPGDVELDYVGSVDNAARVIAALHAGEKRLVFCDSRQIVEQLGAALRSRGVTTFLSHASLSMDERRGAEQAFAEGRDCVIVATSTLELGIDVGDLDRVIQINAPTTVAAFLQRMGRTGRRAGTTRNCLFLALTEQNLLWAAALLLLWGSNWVEPVQAPPEPRHIVAQQLLALCLQEHQVGEGLWREWWDGLDMFGAGDPIAAHLVENGFVERDSGMMFIGPEAEKRFGHRHFMELTSVFTAPPEFTVVHGRAEVGRTDPSLLTTHDGGTAPGPKVLLLAGRSWRVSWVDWKRRRCFVEPAEGGGKARWTTFGLMGASYELSQAAREVLLGADPPVRHTERTRTRFAAVRDAWIDTVHPGGAVVTRDASGDVRWWTWAGLRANLTLRSTLGGLADPQQRADDACVRLRPDVSAAHWDAELADAPERLCLPDVDAKALAGLKFNAALPQRLAEHTLASRLADLDGARAALRGPHRFTVT